MGVVLNVHGSRLEASVTGEGPASFVWGHGLLGARSTEDAVGLIDWPRIAESVRLVRYDARAHGSSSIPTDPDELRWSSLGLDMLAVADELAGDGPLFLGGASMGCATAIYAALAAEPGRVDGLVLMIPPTAWETRTAQVKAYTTGAAMLRDRPKQVGRLMAVSSTAPFGKVISPGYPDAMKIFGQHVKGLDASAIAAIFDGAARSDLPDPADLARITCPALLLAWVGDPGHPISTAEALHERLPDSELHIARSPEDVHRWSDLIPLFLQPRP